jgi:hypothetical protein
MLGCAGESDLESRDEDDKFNIEVMWSVSEID